MKHKINKQLQFMDFFCFFYYAVFNLNNPQDMNMVWMNNSGNTGMAGSNPMIIDENSIQFFNTQPVAGSMNQQQAQLMVFKMIAILITLLNL